MEISNLKVRVTLNNGVKMPYFGLGMFLNRNEDEIETAMIAAWDCGYRLFDTASIYKNEASIGNVIKKLKFDRNELFLTSKVWNSDQGYDNTLKACEASLERLQLDYLDLYLIHWPVEGQFIETWKALEALHKSGKVKAIGVSNFMRHHLETLIPEVSIIPSVNQIEYHPWLTQPGLIEFIQNKGIRVQSWAPLMKGKVFEIPLLNELAQKYCKSEVQIVLRWNLQNRIVVIPKSVNPERIVANQNIFDFSISRTDMQLINGLNRDQRIGPDPDNFNF